jgi:hypothetical protein
MAPSKREGIRHAVTAEALRCIGADEVDRLQQLVNSGMPMSIDIGGKNLYDWSMEMDAIQCEILLRPSEAERHGETTSGRQTVRTGGDSNITATTGQRRPSWIVRDSRYAPGQSIDELNLFKALSICLDNLAEEVSHGLLREVQRHLTSEVSKH